MKTKNLPPTPDLRILRRLVDANLTGLVLCDRNCPCGTANGLWWVDSPAGWKNKAIAPWMNGADSASLWRYLIENGMASEPI